MQMAWNPGRRYAALAIVSASLATLASSGFDRPVPSYGIGDFADRSIRAPYDFVVADPEATARQRAEAARRSPIVIDVSDARDLVTGSLTEVLDPLAAAVAAAGPAPEPPPNATARAKRIFDAAIVQHRHRLDAAMTAALPDVEAAAGSPAPPVLRDLLARNASVADLRATLDAIAMNAYARPVVMDLAAVWTAAHPSTDPPAAYDVLLVTGAGERTAREPGSLVSLSSAKAAVLNASPSTPNLPGPVDSWLRRTVAGAMRPNAVVDVTSTLERRAAAARAVIPASLSLRRNQLIVGEGQPVTAQTVLALDYLRLERSQRYSWARVMVQAALLFVVLALAFLSFDGYRPRFIDDDGVFTYGLLSLATVAVSFLAWEAMSDRVGAAVSSSTGLAAAIAFPASALSMYTRMVAPQATVARLLVAQALVCGLIWQADARLAFFVLASGWVGSHLVAHCSRRQGLLRAGAITGLVSAPIAGGLIVLDASAQQAFGVTALAGLASGVLSALAVLALGPAFELLFGHLTRIRLVELVNYQHPLLRRLTEAAPGTFQHSIGVGVLADAAARATGADPLMVRVAALYHDVGKTTRPEMFVENQQGWNPHDALAPDESARYIIEHVPEGVRLLREHRFSERIIDFVREHHGTSTVRYFLARAEHSGRAIDRREFVYPGPSPRSLETLIVMLADQVEATARSMPNSDAAALAAMVDRTIERTRSDGQLQECPVTLRDLTAIRQALVTTLEGMAHRRIQYPGQGVAAAHADAPARGANAAHG